MCVNRNLKKEVEIACHDTLDNGLSLKKNLIFLFLENITYYNECELIFNKNFEKNLKKIKIFINYENTPFVKH